LKRLTILLTFGFRDAYRKVAEWLRRHPWDLLFLDLPKESEPFIKACAEKKATAIEFWRSYGLLTGLAEPFVNSLRLRFQSILEGIRNAHLRGREIRCYRDLKSYIDEKKILERIFLLEFRYQVTGRLEVEEWKDILCREMETAGDTWNRAVERILEEAEPNSRNTVLYGGHLESTNRLRRPHTELEVILLEDYWKSPLDILRTLLWRHGTDKISDERIESYLKLQKKYLDLVIGSKDVDEAHRAWTHMIQRTITPTPPE